MIFLPQSEQTAELYSWLCSFINMEWGRDGSPLGGSPVRGKPLDGKSPTAEEHFKLDRIRTLADLAGHPESSAPVIHIAGSKGKGSVAAMTASILEAAGIKTARYMSPHVSDWRERICRGGGSFFPETVYAQAGRELRGIYETYRQLPPDLPGGPGDPTFFELTTMLFFLCARLDSCKALVVETGLGGRLDATNIVDPAVSVITVIEKEHTEYLGSTLAAIAGEKAGIIKRNRPVVSAEQKPEVLAVLRQSAEQNAAPFLYLPDYAGTDFPDMQIHRNGTDFTLQMEAPNGRNFKRRLSVPIPGRIYACNAALAVSAVTTAFPHIDDESIERGLASSALPARFEKLRAEPPFIVDGAHTPLSAGLCAETFCDLYGKGGILLFGCAADKDAQAMAELFAPCFSRCIITAPGSFKASDPAAVCRSFCEAAQRYSKSTGKTQPDIVCIPGTAAAIEETLRLSGKTCRPVLACGSFYLAAEIRNAFEFK
ncbi:MAG: bifunctional folylpolyglutamate synthase/dihydrofolate synthase [Spirochaetaceae bacterium]|jgi:dihydrofolate synthase/folylpolyglutamate synthase|nr:bifunctional folylpolyglutamate synthase/dihydrofolate synthase [Spirochaetaceae bacterium]